MEENDVIREYVAGGPKQYALRFWSDREKKEKFLIKVRGFSIKHAASQDLNFESMRRLVHAMVQDGDKEKDPVILKFPQIVRNSDRSVTTKISQKVYYPVYNKRLLLPNFSTLPFGYC